MRNEVISSQADFDRLGLWHGDGLDPAWETIIRRTWLGITEKYVDWEPATRLTAAVEHLRGAGERWTGDPASMNLRVAAYFRSTQMAHLPVATTSRSDLTASRPVVLFSKFVVGADADQAVVREHLHSDRPQFGVPSGDRRQSTVSHELFHPVVQASVLHQPLQWELNYVRARTVGGGASEKAEVVRRLGPHAATSLFELYAEALRVYDEYGKAADDLVVGIGQAFDRWMTRTSPGAQRFEELLVRRYEEGFRTPPHKRETGVIRDLAEWADQWSAIEERMLRNRPLPAIEFQPVNLSGQLRSAVQVLVPEPVSARNTSELDLLDAQRLARKMGLMVDLESGETPTRLTREASPLGLGWGAPNQTIPEPVTGSRYGALVPEQVNGASLA